MKKLVAVCVGALLLGVVGCGGAYAEEPETLPPTAEPAPGDPNTASTGELADFLGYEGPSEPMDGAALPEEDGTVSQMMVCGSSTYLDRNTCRSDCFRVGTCGDGRPKFKCDSVTYEIWHNPPPAFGFANFRTNTVGTWWCANSAPNNCPAFFCN
ncbi:hypothetical protein ACLESO_38430 [Pyxidicoccus sp. 3LG]